MHPGTALTSNPYTGLKNCINEGRSYIEMMASTNPPQIFTRQPATQGTMM